MHGSKHKGFRLSSQAIAENNANKGSMTVYPDGEWLRKYVGKANEDGSKANILSQSEYENILKNGISVISDKKNFKNPLFQASYVTPLQASVNYAKEKGVTIKDPFNENNTFTMKTDPDGLGDYVFSYTNSALDPNTGKIVKGSPSTTSSVQVGSNLELLRDNMLYGWGVQREMINEQFRNR